MSTWDLSSEYLRLAEVLEQLLASALTPAPHSLGAGSSVLALQTETLHGPGVGFEC